MSWLYRYETKGIQSWILDSNLLRDLAGGSALVEELPKCASKRAIDANGKVLQATSGAMTARFDNLADLQRFASVWPLEVALRAPGLQLVQAWVDEGEKLEGLFVRLAAARNSAFVTDIESGPWVLRAGKSGLPAVPSPRVRSKARPTALDTAALAKEGAREALAKEPGAVTGGHPWREFNETLEEWYDTEGPVAVVHADGTGVGERLLSLDIEDLEGFSAALRRVTVEATRSALEKVPKGDYFDARPVVSAGDDMTYIVPASCARDFAREWLRALEEGSAAEPALRGKMVGGAGIAVVHRKYPFSQAYEIAEDLCNAAKNKLKKLKEQGVSVMAFRRITTSWVESVKHNALGWRLRGGDDPLDALRDAVARLPRGTMRGWLTSFEKGEPSAEQMWQRAREVASKDVWENFEEALRESGADPRTGALLADAPTAVSLDDKGQPTPVRDALALRYFEKEAR